MKRSIASVFPVSFGDPTDQETPSLSFIMRLSQKIACWSRLLANDGGSVYTLGVAVVE